MDQESRPSPRQRRVAPSEHNPVRHKKQKPFKDRCIKALGLHHLALVILLIIYAFIGGGIFYGVERPAELRHNENSVSKAQLAADRLMNEIIKNGTNNPNCIKTDALREIIRRFQLDEGIGPMHTIHWTYWSAFFYACTIFTTIGYGNFAPQTMGGRIATIVYAFVGIPLMIAVLNDLGHLFSRYIQFLYKKVRSLCCKEKKLQPSSNDEEGSAEEEPNLVLLLLLGISLMFISILVTAAIFGALESGWTYFQAFYFCFITFTTIGLGDFVPTNTRNCMILLALVMLGLCFISMCITIFATAVETARNKATDLIEEKFDIDIDTDSEDERPKKASKEQLQLNVCGNSKPSNNGQSTMSNGTTLGVIKYDGARTQLNQP